MDEVASIRKIRGPLRTIRFDSPSLDSHGDYSVRQSNINLGFDDQLCKDAKVTVMANLRLYRFFNFPVLLSLLSLGDSTSCYRGAVPGDWLESVPLVQASQPLLFQ